MRKTAFLVISSACLLACSREATPPLVKEQAAKSAAAAPSRDRTAAKKAVLDSAEKALNAQDYTGALAILGRFEWLKDDPDAAVLRQRVAEEELRTRPERDARARQAQASANEAARVTYAAALREKFLDDGLDIKVSVSGDHAERLDLHYVLFNDVWLHKFRKGSLIQEIWMLGFTRIDFRDGYDYHMYLTRK